MQKEFNRIVLMSMIPWVFGSARQEIYVQPLQSAPLLTTSIIRSDRHPTLDRIAFTSFGKELVVVESATLRAMFSYPQLPNSLAAVRFSPNGMLITARIDGQINFWDVEKKTMVKSMTAHTGGLLDGAIDRQGNMILAGGDNALKVYDMKNMTDVFSVSLSPENIASFALHPNG
ncbi:MAG: hypothetical protein WEB37_02925, partial [Bacteroidota bacterium]